MKDKKPFYKTWWGILLIIFILVAMSQIFNEFSSDKGLVEKAKITDLRNGLKTATIGYYAEIKVDTKKYSAKEFYEQLSEVFNKYDGKNNDKKINFAIIYLNNDRVLHTMDGGSVSLAKFDKSEQGIYDIENMYAYSDNTNTYIDVDNKNLDIFKK